jgi:diguanylate cyclase (GGDEF)-like protein
MLPVSYDNQLVLVSFLVAVMSAYTALDLAGRIHTAAEGAAKWWLLGGAVAMGFGIWSMHFIGMLAFQLPIEVGYDVRTTLASLLLGILASAFALWKMAMSTFTARHLISSALIMGTGIIAMHYTGMAALRMEPGIRYDFQVVLLSVLIAVVVSGVALKIAHSLLGLHARIVLKRGLAALLMGAAIVGMHYTGMSAAGFPANSICLSVGDGLAPRWMAVMVFIITLSVLAITLVTSVLDARLESRTARLANSLTIANQQLKKQALYDNLTGLANRVLLEDRLEQAMSKARREKGRFALMFLDLDGFKAINDSLGHHSGDMLLIETAERIRSVVRLEDTIARLAGDEFVILVEVTQPEDAAAVAEKLNHIINQPYEFHGEQFGVSGSIGIALFPDNGTTAHQLMVNADAAMYHTKNFGRNGYSFFESSMDVNAHNRLSLMQDLRYALEKNQLRLYYQPKVYIPHGPISGVEALLRWQHPERGLIGPDEFIGLAERIGVIVPIGEWVLREACRQMKQWHDLGHREWSVAVNLSPLQFSNDGLVHAVEDALRESGLPAQSLILEITESIVMTEVETTLQILDRLVKLGVLISIDDFGTGYSSLLYLKRFPAMELKIDRNFIKNLASGPNDAAIVSAIVGLGHSLDLNVVAEGVETAREHDLLAELGCHTMQGFWTAKPLPPDEFMQVVNGPNRSYFLQGDVAFKPDDPALGPNGYQPA